MICDVIDTAVLLNNNLKEMVVPYTFLTRIEHPPLLPIDTLSQLSFTSECITPFTFVSAEQQIKLNYQRPCVDHLKFLFIDYTTVNHLVYLSMTHFKNYIKHDQKPFYYNQYYQHCHFVCQIVDFNTNGIHIKPLLVKNKQDYINHLVVARQMEQQFNLKYQLKRFCSCHHCLPTLCGLAIDYQPTTWQDVPDHYNTITALIKNERINIQLLCDKAKQKWHVYDQRDYDIKMFDLCAKRHYDFDKVIHHIHHIHYGLYKSCEDKVIDFNNGIIVPALGFTNGAIVPAQHININKNNTNNTTWHKKKLASPTWRSQLIVQPF